MKQKCTQIPITFLDSVVEELLLSKLGVVLLTSPTPKRSKTELLVLNSVGRGESSSLSITVGLITLSVLDFGITFLVTTLMGFCDCCEGTFFLTTFNIDSSSSSLSLETLTFLVTNFFTLLVTEKKKMKFFLL